MTAGRMMGGERSHAGGHDATAPERARGGPSPEDRAHQARAIAENLETFRGSVEAAVAAMVTAAASEDRRGWDAARARADNALELAGRAAAVAITRAADAADPEVAEKLRAAPELQRHLAELIALAPPAPEERGPDLSCGGALLAALPPDAPGTDSSVFTMAERQVAGIFRTQMTSADIAALRAILGRHPGHEIARRFRRFSDERRTRLLSILDDARVRAHAVMLQNARRQVEAAAPPPGYQARRIDVSGAGAPAGSAAPLTIDRPPEYEETRGTIEIGAARPEPAEAAPEPATPVEPTVYGGMVTIDKPPEYEETRGTVEIGRADGARTHAAAPRGPAGPPEPVPDHLAIPREIEATIMAEIAIPISSSNMSAARARRKRLVALFGSIASPYRERLAERLSARAPGDRLVASIRGEFHPATVEALHGALLGLPEAAPPGEAGLGLRQARLVVHPGEVVTLDRDLAPRVTIRITPRMSAPLPFEAPPTTLTWRRDVGAGPGAQVAGDSAEDETLTIERGTWDSLSTDGESYAFEVVQGGKRHRVRCEIVQEGLVIAVHEVEVEVRETQRSDRGTYRDGRAYRDEFRWKDENVQRKRSEDLVGAMAVDTDSLAQAHASREAQLADPSLQGRERAAVADELATIEFAAAQRDAPVWMATPGPDAITLGNQILDDDPVYLRQVLEGMYASSDAATVEGWLTTCAREADELRYDPTDASDPMAGVRASERARGIVSTLRTQWTLLRSEIEHFVAEFRERAKDATLHRLHESYRRVLDEGNRYGIDVHAAGGPDPDKADPAARAGMLRAAGILAASQRQLDDVRKRAEQAGIRSLKRSNEYTPAGAGVFPAVDPAYAEYDDLGDDDLSRLVATFERLEGEVAREHSRRVVLACAEFPVLALYKRDAGDQLEVDADGLGRVLRPEGPDAEIAARSAEITSNITTTIEALMVGRLDIWRHPRIVDITRADMLVVPGSVRDAAIRNQVAAAQGDGGWTEIALLAVSIALAVVSAVATGGGSAIAEAAFLAELGTLGLDAMVALDRLQAYQVGTAATNTDYDRARALAEDEPDLLWLALDLVAVGLDLHAMATTFRKVSGAWRAAGDGGTAVDDGVQVVRAEQAAGRLGSDTAERLEGEMLARGGRAGETAGASGGGDAAARARDAVADGRARISSDRVGELSQRLGVPIEIDDTGRLTSGIEVRYERRADGGIEPTVVRVGPQALVADVAAHQQTIRRITRYNGLLGKLRRLWDRILVLAGGVNKFPPGSKAWESFEELKKLDALIELRQQARMADGLVDPAVLDAEIAFLDGYRAHHDAIITAAEQSGQYGKGVGHIDSPERWREPLGEGPTVEGMHAHDPVGKTPHKQRLPEAKDVQPDRPAAEASSGFWADESASGNTDWYSDNQLVNEITGYKPVRFKDGYPVLDDYAEQTVFLEKMRGDKSDFGPADVELARRHGKLKADGTPNQTWARRYRDDHRLTWHHHQDGVRMQLVPMDLHRNIPHAGGASAARDARHR